MDGRWICLYCNVVPDGPETAHEHRAGVGLRIDIDLIRLSKADCYKRALWRGGLLGGVFKQVTEFVECRRRLHDRGGVFTRRGREVRGVADPSDRQMDCLNPLVAPGPRSR